MALPGTQRAHDMAPSPGGGEDLEGSPDFRAELPVLPGNISQGPMVTAGAWSLSPSPACPTQHALAATSVTSHWLRPGLSLDCNWRKASGRAAGQPRMPCQPGCAGTERGPPSEGDPVGAEPWAALPSCCVRQRKALLRAPSRRHTGGPGLAWGCGVAPGPTGLQCPRAFLSQVPRLLAGALLTACVHLQMQLWWGGSSDSLGAGPTFPEALPAGPIPPWPGASSGPVCSISPVLSPGPPHPLHVASAHLGPSVQLLWANRPPALTPLSALLPAQAALSRLPGGGSQERPQSAKSCSSPHRDGWSSSSENLWAMFLDREHRVALLGKALTPEDGKCVLTQCSSSFRFPQSHGSSAVPSVTELF